ncbi:MAG TPA: hypothetical protein VK495_00940 [Steroidobacteraceae bacterium]|jgi:hypothetical protein|nr:hypothetical protein [Steroidobacteraceae bacterium]
MLRLAKAFLDIALWRQTPAHLPASRFLLVLTACAAALLEVLDVLLSPGPQGRIVTRVALEAGLPLAFTWVLLTLGRQRARFLQTATALLGVGVLAGIVLYPLAALRSAIGDDRIASIPVGLLLFVGFIWYLLACAHIWRAALDSGLIVGGVISVGYLIVTIALEQQLLPHT